MALHSLRRFSWHPLLLSWNWLWISCALSIQGLNLLNVIWLEAKLGLISAVDRCHECRAVAAVVQTQRMSDLMGCCLGKVHPNFGRSQSPDFVVVKVQVTREAIALSGRSS